MLMGRKSSRARVALAGFSSGGAARRQAVAVAPAAAKDEIKKVRRDASG
jgi:hypothetical protein